MIDRCWPVAKTGSSPFQPYQATVSARRYNREVTCMDGVVLRHIGLSLPFLLS